MDAGNQHLSGLLARAALRDEQAFHALYQATAGHLLGLAVGLMGSRERAEDVLQEAYLKAWHAAGQYRADVATPMTWLINIVRNQAIDRLRTGRAERASTTTLDDDALTVPDAPERQPQRLIEQSLERAQVQQCMAGLSAGQRQALALAYYQGLVHTEIADALGTPLGTVKAWVRRGLDRLRGCLQSVGVQASA